LINFRQARAIFEKNEKKSSKEAQALIKKQLDALAWRDTKLSHLLRYTFCSLLFLFSSLFLPCLVILFLATLMF
jgi:hypothetical protein